MIVNGKLCIQLDDEQLDKVVIDHCRAAAQTCLDVINIDKKRYKEAESINLKGIIHIDLEENQKYLDALNTVIEYFGGVQVQSE